MESTEGTTNEGISIPGETNTDPNHNPSAPDYETSAKEKGWRPKEEFEGDLDAWIPAEEFIKRQPLFDKIKTQSKKLKELEKTVEALSKHYKIGIEQAKERAISELKEQRKEAIELGEVATVEQLDLKIDQVKQMSAPETNSTGLAPEIESFIKDQKIWFNKDLEMTDFAVSYNESYLRRNPGDLEKSLAETLKAVKKAYPDKFENPRRKTPPPVETGEGAEKGAGKYAFSRLNNEQKIVYNQLVKTHKQMSHDEYFKSLEEAGFLEN